MTRYVYRPEHPLANENGLVSADLAWEKVSLGSSAHVIRDEMEPTKHMATGEYFTSKAKFRQRTRDMGCVEVGNDASLTRERKPAVLDRTKRREDIQRAIYELRNR